MLSKTMAWYKRITSTSIKFFLVLIFSYIGGIISINLYFHAYIVNFFAILTALIPFLLISMLITDNDLYKKFINIKWVNMGQGVLLVGYGYLSYAWTTSEINSVFSVSPDNFKVALAFLTVVFFYKNIVLTASAIFLVLSFIYSYYWVLKVFVLKFSSFKKLMKDIASGVIIFFGCSLAFGQALAISVHKEKFIELVAVKADFNKNHNCKGGVFEDSLGVVFLSNEKVLVAKLDRMNPNNIWDFIETKCE